MCYKLQKQYRLPYNDYSNEGLYFITICTKEQKHYFGEIISNRMQFSEIGKIAEIFWLQIPEKFENAKLDEWIIMPNHLHGILFIEDKNKNTPRRVHFK